MGAILKKYREPWGPETSPTESARDRFMQEKHETCIRPHALAPEGVNAGP
jgi:hypothetical protein